MKLLKTPVIGISVGLLVSLSLSAPPATAAAKKTTKPKTTKSKTTKPNNTKTRPASSSAGSLIFTCTGSDFTGRLTEHTVTGTVDSNIVMTNVVVTKNYVEQGGAAVLQPVVVLRSASPKLTTPRESVEKFVVYQFNKVPLLATAADVGTYTYDYRINFPDTIPTGPEFESVILIQGYLGKEGKVANDQTWDDTKLVIASAECKFVP
jgi:hypothetical protein